MALSASTFSCVFSVAAGICMHPSRLTYRVLWFARETPNEHVSAPKNAFRLHSVGCCGDWQVVQLTIYLD